jgi:hypothetical protein
MRKKQNDYLDVEAMKLGLKHMLEDVIVQLEGGHHSDAIRAVFTDRKTHIEQRLEELK